MQPAPSTPRHRPVPPLAAPAGLDDDDAAGTPAALTPHDELVLPLHRQVVSQYFDTDEGRELRLFYGDKEISFDEPGFFAFGEALARQPRFAAGEAMAWGQGYAWDQVQPLLAQLIDEGVLHHAASRPEVDGAAQGGPRPAPLPPGPCPRARSWADCEAITTELTGLPLELGHLELAVPIFRVAHMALDADGRQVGESNVFPQALRIDVPTTWRACIYSGTRFQDQRPMNVTALKAMRAHWPQMMALVMAMRSAYLRRFPDADGAWTVGHLERLATAVLALPTYLLMRADRPVANGALHPALSSVFRVTDGVRMTMHQMLFVPVGEPTLSPHAPMDAAQILAYAERNYSFHSEHGVCAGPRVMIEEFLAVLIDGRLPERHAGVLLDAGLQDAVAAIEPALDYGLMGLQLYAAEFSLWPLMARAYERLLAVIDGWAGERSERLAGAPGQAPHPLDGLRETLNAIVDRLRGASYLANEQWRIDREGVYADMFAQCARGLGDAPGQPALGQAIATHRPRGAAGARQALRQRLLQRYAGGGAADDVLAIDRLTAALMDFFTQEQAVLRSALAAQARINGLLGRAAPKRPFGSAEVDLHNLLQAPADRRVPDLVGEFSRLLGARITVHPDAMAVVVHPTEVAA